MDKRQWRQKHDRYCAVSDDLLTEAEEPEGNWPKLDPEDIEWSPTSWGTTGTGSFTIGVGSVVEFDDVVTAKTAELVDPPLLVKGISIYSEAIETSEMPSPKKKYSLGEIVNNILGKSK